MVMLKIISTFNLIYQTIMRSLFILKEVPHLTNQNPDIENDLLNLIRNRNDLKEWLLAISKYGDEIQQDLNAIVGHDEKFNNAIVRHALDLKDEAIFRNPNPINVTFHDMKKFDQVNPVIGKLATQVKASKLTDFELTKEIQQKGKVDELQLRLDKLNYGIPKDDDDTNTDLEVGAEVVVVGRQVLWYHQELHNKKWMK